MIARNDLFFNGKIFVAVSGRFTAAAGAGFSKSGSVLVEKNKIMHASCVKCNCNFRQLI